MAIWYLEVKHIKIKHCPILHCPNPQYTAECMGLFIKTRQYQKECVACMQLHKTIDRHPLLTILRTQEPRYDAYEVSLMH